MCCGGFLHKCGAPYSESFVLCGIGMRSLKTYEFLERIVVYFPDHRNATLNRNKYFTRQLWKAIHKYKFIFKW